MQETNLSAKIPSIICGISILILFLFTSTFSTKWLSKSGLNYETTFLTTRFIIWGILLLLFFYVRKIEKLPFLLWPEQKYSPLFILKAIGKTFLFVILAMICVGITIKVLHVNIESTVMTKMVKLLKDNFMLLLFASITAGLTEELIFRGYLLSRLDFLFKNTKAAIIVSSLIFGLLHYSYGTLLQIIGPTAIGLVFAHQYHKNKNIQIVIICHFLWDFIVLFIQTHAHLK
jgi:membrane protease YdiL (CAAX protease family)